jgi:simple sugar transport system ATP-binding protein
MKRERQAQLRNIHKIYESPPDGTGEIQRFTALEGVTLAFSTGQIHTLLGENGAGKSTLVHILSGLHQPTQGSINIGGQDFLFRSPSQALSAGIAMVHQRPLISEEINVLENIILGSGGFFLHRASCIRKIRKYIDEWKIPVHLDAPGRSLNPAERLYTALLGALYSNPDFLILDEPTSPLASEEREVFFRSLQKARDRGLGIILITHKLDEAVRWSDHISILRQGQLVYSMPVHDPVDSLPVTEERLAAFFSPSSAENTKPHPHPASEKGADENLRSAGISFTLSGITSTPKDRFPVHDVSCMALPGRITGIFGLPGSGLETLEDILSGMMNASEGTVSVGDIRIPASHIRPALMRKLGVAFVPSDRSFRGSNPALSLYDLLTSYRTDSFFLDRAANMAFVRSVLTGAQLDADPLRLAGTLSGGQLQRLVLARELSARPRVLVLAEPEWGLDPGSTALLRETLKTAAANGMTILVLTEDTEALDTQAFYSDTYLLREGQLA